MPLIRVLEIPPPTGTYHFRSGEPQTFIEVDWFRDDDYIEGHPDAPVMTTERGRELIIAFIKQKRYFKPGKAFLVLHQDYSMTIGYSAP